MAEQSKPFFNIDAKKILATLHLAGQSQVKNRNGQQSVINTAVINPVKVGDPSKLGNTQFDLSKDEYQVATGYKTFFKLPISLELNKDLAKLYKEFKQLEEKENKNQSSEKNESIKIISFSNFLLTEANNEEGSDKGLLDKDNGSNKQNEKNNNKDSGLNTISEKINKDLYKKANELIQIYNTYINVCTSNKFKDLQQLIKDNTKDIKIKNKDGKEIDSNVITNFKQIDKLFQDAIKDENDIINKEYEKNIQETIQKNVEDLKAYFNSFCGKESANAINEQNVVLKPGDIEGDFTPESFKYIKDFSIDYETIEKSCEEFDKKYQSDIKNYKNYIERTMLCIVSYEINKDTM